mmetsp:Transcript_35843/g.44442  ORF Transcript_35843/g.44442 Transcript_35843/m.44442 type:complete len:522 (+) Transcript_35843:85-1650(+)
MSYELEDVHHAQQSLVGHQVQHHLVPGVGLPEPHQPVSLPKKKRKRRCAVCLEFKCEKMHSCPGNSNKKNCKCDHRKSKRSCATCKDRRCIKADSCPGRGGRKFHNCDCVELEGLEYQQEYNEDGTLKKKKRSRRCAVCMQYSCEEQYTCPGNSNKKNCKCNHRRTKRTCYICKQHGPCGREGNCGGKGGRKFHQCFCTTYMACPEQKCKEEKRCSCETAEILKQEFAAKDEKLAQRKKTRRRCSTCVKFKCEKAENCPGNANKKKCKCNHKKSKRTCQICKNRFCDRMNLCRGKGGKKWHKCECDNLPIPDGPPQHDEMIVGEDGVIQKAKRRRRCTVCIRFNCEQMYNCPGNSNKKNCKCNHKKCRRTCATCKENKCRKANQCPGRGGRKFHNCICSGDGPIEDYRIDAGEDDLDGGHKKKRTRRCAVCMKFNCEEQYNCPGNSNKKYCKCNHKKSRRTCQTCKAQGCPRCQECAGKGGKKFHDCECTPCEICDLNNCLNKRNCRGRRSKMEHFCDCTA